MKIYKKPENVEVVGRAHHKPYIVMEKSEDRYWVRNLVTGNVVEVTGISSIGVTELGVVLSSVDLHKEVAVKVYNNALQEIAQGYGQELHVVENNYIVTHSGNMWYIQDNRGFLVYKTIAKNIMILTDRYIRVRYHGHWESIIDLKTGLVVDSSDKIKIVDTRKERKTKHISLPVDYRQRRMSLAKYDEEECWFVYPTNTPRIHLGGGLLGTVEDDKVKRYNVSLEDVTSEEEDKQGIEETISGELCFYGDRTLATTTRDNFVVYNNIGNLILKKYIGKNHVMILSEEKDVTDMLWLVFSDEEKQGTVFNLEGEELYKIGEFLCVERGRLVYSQDGNMHALDIQELGKGDISEIVSESVWLPHNGHVVTLEKSEEGVKVTNLWLGRKLIDLEVREEVHVEGYSDYPEAYQVVGGFESIGDSLGNCFIISPYNYDAVYDDKVGCTFGELVNNIPNAVYVRDERHRCVGIKSLITGKIIYTQGENWVYSKECWASEDLAGVRVYDYCLNSLAEYRDCKVLGCTLYYMVLKSEQGEIIILDSKGEEQRRIANGESFEDYITYLKIPCRDGVYRVNLGDYTVIETRGMRDRLIDLKPRIMPQERYAMHGMSTTIEVYDGKEYVVPVLDTDYTGVEGVGVECMGDKYMQGISYRSLMPKCLYMNISEVGITRDGYQAVRSEYDKTWRVNCTEENIGFRKSQGEYLFDAGVEWVLCPVDRYMLGVKPLANQYELQIKHIDNGMARTIVCTNFQIVDKFIIAYVGYRKVVVIHLDFAEVDYITGSHVGIFDEQVVVIDEHGVPYIFERDEWREWQDMQVIKGNKIEVDKETEVIFCTWGKKKYMCWQQNIDGTLHTNTCEVEE